MKRFVRTFFETIAEGQSELTGEWVSSGPRYNNIDTQINDFATSNPTVKIIDVKNVESIYPHATEPNLRHRQLTYVLIYESDKEIVAYEKDIVMPLPPGAQSPTIEAWGTENGRRMKFQIMCGVFPAQEGHKMERGDTRPAPVPVFSPSLDLQQMQHYFGNIKKD